MAWHGVAWCGVCTQLVADQFGVSRRRVQQIAKYRETGIIPTAKKPSPKPEKCNIREQVIAARNKTGGSATLELTSGVRGV